MTASEHRIFVSHSHLDNEFGTKLAQDLRRVLSEDSAVFYDVMGGLHGGETWWEKIIEELTARDVFLLVLSPDALNSRWVRLEINMALDQSKFILPVLHRTCAIRADLKTIQNVSFLAPKRYEAAFQEILLALHLPLDTPIVPEKPKIQRSDPAAALIQHMETAFTEQDWPDVIRKADYLVKHMPESMTSLVYRWQGVALLEEGKEQQAQEAFEIALALVSDRQQRLTLLSDYTALLVRQQQWTEVLQRAREALRLVPHDPAWEAMQQQAQDQLAPQVPPTSPPQKQKQTREKEPSSVPLKTKEQWMNEGDSHYNLKRYEGALSAYKQAIRLDANFALAHYSKGSALNALKRYEEAVSAYEQAILLDANFALAHYNKGSALYDLKRYEEALSAYEQAIHLNPNDALAYHGKGNALRELKQYAESLSALEQAIRLNPNDAVAHYNKGLALYYLNRYEEAISANEQAIHLDPNFVLSYNNKGWVLNELKRHEEALSVLDQAIHLDPTFGLAYNNKGIILEQLGKKGEAQIAYDKARQLGYSG